LLAKSLYWKIAKMGRFDDIIEPTDDYNEYVEHKESFKTRKSRKRRADILNNIPKIPDVPEEILALRKRYDNDPKLYDLDEHGFPDPARPNHYALAHQEIFTTSTGIKPFCDEQINSVRHSQIIIQRGGRIVKAEPRGFGKTSRSCNEGLLGVLQGYIPYLLIIGSTTEKAEEIVNSIVTEIMENEEISRMYPRVVACFQHIQANTNKAGRQTYDGELTHIYYNQGLIKFPILPGEPSSGAVINVRPKKNVRGIYFTDKAGPYAGKRRRPTHTIFDDVQTDEEAEQPKVAEKIVRVLKKSVLRASGHNKRMAAIMSCTPIAPGDVSHHFLLNEPGWNRVVYQMLKSRSNNEDMWLGEYAKILTDFNKEVPGSQEKAALRALEYYKANRDKMDEGAEASWEWCYEYDDEPQLEISAIQHAYNIMIIEGMDVFESECQCNVIHTQTAENITIASIQRIAKNQSVRERGYCQQGSRHIVTHIDVGFDYLTYVTMSSPPQFMGEIIDYGTYPSYPGRFGKRKMGKTLAKIYPTIPLPEDRVYQAVKDLINIIGQKVYRREDGIEMYNNAILTDSSFLSDNIYKAIRESNFRSISYPCEGESYKAKDKGIADKKYSDACTKYYHTVLVPNTDRVLRKLNNDVNFMKTEVHKAFCRNVGTSGSISLFKEEYPNQHLLLGEHCNAELPTVDIDERNDKEVIIWNQISGRDNELFDNIVGCLGGMSMLGVDFLSQAVNVSGGIDLNEWMKEYGGR